MFIEPGCMIAEAQRHIGESPKNSKFIADTVLSRAPYTGQKGWCGDYALYLLKVAGVCDCAILNRADVCGSWTPSINITKLGNYAKAAGLVYTDPALIRPGHFYVKPRSDGDHIGLIIDVDRVNRTYRTVDGNGVFGQVSRGNRKFTSSVRYFINTHGIPVTLNSAPGLLGVGFFEPSPDEMITIADRVELDPDFGGDSSELLPGED